MSETNTINLDGNVVTDTANLSKTYSKQEVDKKFDQMTVILLSVVVILLIMVATLIIDSFHFNSAIYKEYAEKSSAINTIQQTNNALLNQIKNQQQIIDKQKELLQKK